MMEEQLTRPWARDVPGPEMDEGYCKKRQPHGGEEAGSCARLGGACSSNGDQSDHGQENETNSNQNQASLMILVRSLDQLREMETYGNTTQRVSDEHNRTKAPIQRYVEKHRREDAQRREAERDQKIN